MPQPLFPVSRRFAALAALFSAVLCPAADQAYLYTSFRGNGDGLHLAASSDALHWTDLNRVFLRPAVGEKLFRDPFLLRDLHGLYRLVWTSGWHDLGIGYATSSDLVHWSPQRHLSLAARIPGAKNAWAPEIFHDTARDRYVITWSSEVEGWFAEDGAAGRANNRTYYVTTRDFVEFSEPALLIEPGFDHVDTSIVSWQGQYIALFRQGDDPVTKKWGAHFAAIADSPTGPYRMLPGTVPPATRSEGATVFPLGDRCLLYVPIPAQHRCAVLATRDWQNWDDISADASIVAGQNQGNVVQVPPGLLASLGDPSSAPDTAAGATSADGVPAPILPGLNADPALRVFGDTYYLYPTTDKPNWSSSAFSAWSSKDLITWQPAGTILDLPQSLGWAKRQAWTPDCIERKGTYYLFFCAEAKIGVATARQPTGPFQDALGGPLLQQGGAVRAQTIAPCAFIDDDGQAYLYYGSGRSLAQVVKLGAGLVSVEGAPTDLPLKDFMEGVVVFKRRGLYYFMWTAQTRNQPTRVCYGIADSPLGPVRHPAGNDEILRSNPPLTGAGYHSVLNIPGTDRWYMAYHRQAIPGGGLDKREVCLARMEFTPDGALLPIDPFAPAFPPGSPGEPLSQGRGRP